MARVSPECARFPLPRFIDPLLLAIRENPPEGRSKSYMLSTKNSLMSHTKRSHSTTGMSAAKTMPGQIESNATKQRIKSSATLVLKMLRMWVLIVHSSGPT